MRLPWGQAKIDAVAGGYCPDLLLHMARCFAPYSYPDRLPPDRLQRKLVSFSHHARLIAGGVKGEGTPGETVLQPRPASLAWSSYRRPYCGVWRLLADADSDCCVGPVATVASSASDL